MTRRRRAILNLVTCCALFAALPLLITCTAVLLVRWGWWGLAVFLGTFRWRMFAALLAQGAALTFAWLCWITVTNFLKRSSDIITEIIHADAQ